MSSASLLPFMILLQAAPGEEPATAPPVEDAEHNQSVENPGLNTTAKEEAEELKKQLEEAGAQVELK